MRQVFGACPIAIRGKDWSHWSKTDTIRLATCAYWLLIRVLQMSRISYKTHSWQETYQTIVNLFLRSQACFDWTQRLGLTSSPVRSPTSRWLETSSSWKRMNATWAPPCGKRWQREGLSMICTWLLQHKNKIPIGFNVHQSRSWDLHFIYYL